LQRLKVGTTGDFVWRGGAQTQFRQQVARGAHIAAT